MTFALPENDHEAYLHQKQGGWDILTLLLQPSVGKQKMRHNVIRAILNEEET